MGADPSYLPITRFSIDQSDGVTSISNYLKERTVEVFDVQTPIDVIPNFVNCDLYDRTDEVMQHRSDYATPDEKILVHLSNFRPVKRMHRRDRDLRSGAEEDSGAAADDRRWARALARRVAGGE